MARPDQGSQFTCDDWRLILKAHCMVSSMSPLDKATRLQESAPSGCKTELSAMPHTN